MLYRRLQPRPAQFRGKHTHIEFMQEYGQFDHLDPVKKNTKKEDGTKLGFNVSEWPTKFHEKTEQDLINEIALCRPICPYHHKLHSRDQQNVAMTNEEDLSESHKQKRPRTKRAHAYVLKDKMARGVCTICDRRVTPDTIPGFQYDHLDVHTKKRLEHTISDLASEGYSNERIQEEMDKCRLLCENCAKVHDAWQRKDKRENPDKYKYDPVAPLQRPKGSGCVCFVKQRRKWRALLPTNNEGLQVHLGYFDTKAEAEAALLNPTEHLKTKRKHAKSRKKGTGCILRRKRNDGTYYYAAYLPSKIKHKRYGPRIGTFETREEANDALDRRPAAVLGR